ncbi:MAG: hypothetical protein JO025_14535 [Verrucomicrobia bacterium]|nr:hypothetical protein [Verrucomicrobiota bacterium]
MTELIVNLKELPPSSPKRPGRVQELIGIIFQSDQKSVLGSWIIRPVEMLDRHLAGLGRSPDRPSLAMHVGLHARLADGREFVVEQLVGTPFEDLVDGLNWTPLETFRARDRGGWDVTIPATTFRGIDGAIVNETIEFLNEISVRPFLDEDCTTMVERAFGKRRMFADSPTARAIGLGLRVGDPALALLRPDVRLDDRSEFLLRADTLRALPDPVTDWAAPNAHRIAKRALFLGIIGLLSVGVLSRLFAFLKNGSKEARPL